MKSMIVRSVLLGIVLATPCLSQSATPSAAEARAIAKDAYIFGLPNVYIARQQDILTGVPKPDGTRAPFNQFAHYRDFPDANNRTVVAWNVDTLYSIATLDLTNEPIVLSIPPMGQRWWLMQLLDNWNDVPAAPGTRTQRNAGLRRACHLNRARADSSRTHTYGGYFRFRHYPPTERSQAPRLTLPAGGVQAGTSAAW